MPEQDSLLSRWPLLLVTLLLSLGFAWVFVISLDRAVSARSAELSLETGNAQSVTAPELEITPTLGTLRDAQPLPKRPTQPAPWWPALLFGLAFVSGWTFRHTLKRSGAIQMPSKEASDAFPGQSQRALSRESAAESSAHVPAPTPDSGQSGITATLRSSSPDLNSDFPWDESLISEQDGLSSEEHVARLEKQNASKAEIIKALEKLVVENREKWLHQDETEARLNLHIEELSEDLRVAVRQLQELESKVPSRSGSRHKKTG